MSEHNGDRHTTGISPEQLTAYALGQLEGEELATVKAALGDATCAAARQEAREIQSLATAVAAARSAEPPLEPSNRLRAAVELQLGADAGKESPATVALSHRPLLKRPATWIGLIAGTLACGIALALLLPAVQSSREAARRAQAMNRLGQTEIQLAEERAARRHALGALQERADVSSSAPTASDEPLLSDPYGNGYSEVPATSSPAWETRADLLHTTRELAADGSTRKQSQGQTIGQYAGTGRSDANNTTRSVEARGREREEAAIALELDRLNDSLALRERAAQQAAKARTEFRAGVAAKELEAVRAEATLQGRYKDFAGHPSVREWHELSDRRKKYAAIDAARNPRTGESLQLGVTPRIIIQEEEELLDDLYGTEQYARIVENAFLAPLDQPLSTFSIDVDTASYANVRRFLMDGRLPPADAVRIEELVNYFRYDYAQPKGGDPFSVNMEVAECPWQSQHLLLRVGLKGKEIDRGERPASNLVFLLDVSGSMSDANKLPLLKTAMQMLVGELGENDRVSIVTYASEAGLRLPPTRGHEQEKIKSVIESLSAGGSTHGSAGIQLAYEQARAYFVKEGTNRVILCTDGDLNVGITDDDALVKLIKEKAAGGTFLTVLGFGEGNLKDAKMEKLADNGNGLYAYIDSVREARKVLVEQLTGSTITIAKDVKFQIEFNPHEIAAYRLIGYENRVLAAEDFNDDQKDAGEIGAGHTVTALYELVPVGATSEGPAEREDVEPLRYQETGDRGRGTGDGERATGAVGNALRGVPGAAVKLTDAAKSGELLTLKLRYKQPDGDESQLREYPVRSRGGKFNSASRDMQFAAAVASFGMILRNSEHQGSGNLAAVAEIAGGSLGDDPCGYRAEFVDLVRKAQALGAK